jgi:hypothetical protein
MFDEAFADATAADESDWNLGLTHDADHSTRNGAR